eukprot:g3775.t1
MDNKGGTVELKSVFGATSHESKKSSKRSEDCVDKKDTKDDDELGEDNDTAPLTSSASSSEVGGGVKKSSSSSTSTNSTSSNDNNNMSLEESSKSQQEEDEKNEDALRRNKEIFMDKLEGDHETEQTLEKILDGKEDDKDTKVVDLKERLSTLNVMSTEPSTFNVGKAKKNQNFKTILV